MRARLQKYLPIFLVALSVQILAPICASWAAAVAASDPLSAAEICHSAGFAADQPGSQSGQHSEHAGYCAICCLASASASLDVPTPAAVAAPVCELARVVWQERTPDHSAFRVGSNAQARAPPFPS
jgi:hypothetical protein